MERHSAHRDGTPGGDLPPGATPDTGAFALDDVEIWEPIANERHARAGGPGAHGAGIGRRVVASFPGAVAGAFLITALAFGAAFRPSATGDTAALDAGGPGSAETKTGAAPAGGDLGHLGGDTGTGPGDKPDLEDEPSSKDDAASKDEEATDATKDGGESTPAPEIEKLAIALHLRDIGVKVGWSTCDPDGFAFYKVIRSTDEAVTWPLGRADTVVAVVEDPAAVMALDGSAPTGAKLFYRVIALAERDGALVLACASAIAAIAVPAPAPEPKPEPEPDPTDKPAGTLALSLSLKDGKPYVDWSECAGDWDVYKVVRSTDSTVGWPKGSGDTLVGAVGRDGKTALHDGEAPSGKKAWYRVFCLRETSGGYAVVASTAAKAIAVPAAEPEPEPVVLGFEVDLTGEGVALGWEACTSDSFVFYKVIRSKTSNPSYLPGTDGSQVIAVVEHEGVTSFVDGDVEAGETWYYRVQSIGYMNGHKILLGQTPAIAVTVE